MLKNLLSTLLSASMLTSGISLPVLANEQEFIMEEMEDDVQEMSNEATEEIDEEASQEIIFPEAGETIHSGTLGEGKNGPTWTIDSNGTLTIGKGNFENPYELYSWPWKQNKNISDLIKRVDGRAAFVPKGSFFGAFSNLSNVESIDLSGWNMSSITSMNQMFSDCSQLESLILPGADIFSVKDMYRMFYRCEKLKTLNVSNWNTSSVTDMKGMFSGCSQLETLDVSQWDTSSVTDMSSMFGGCSLKSLDISKWVTSSVIKMNSLFIDCSQLETLNVSNWNTSSVTDMRTMFKNCSQLESLDVSKWDTSSVTDMYEMLNGCSQLKSLDVSKWDTSAVRSMGGLFQGCSQLEALNVSNWNTSSISYSLFGLFSGCEKLQELNLSKWNTSSIEDMRSMFYDCKNLKSLDITNWTISSNVKLSGIFSGCPLKKINYSFSNKSIISELPKDEKWLQNGQGPYTTSEIPNLSSGEKATLIKFNELGEEDPIENPTESIYSLKLSTNSIEIDNFTTFKLEIEVLKDGKQLSVVSLPSLHPDPEEVSYSSLTVEVDDPGNLQIKKDVKEDENKFVISCIPTRSSKGNLTVKIEKFNLELTVPYIINERSIDIDDNLFNLKETDPKKYYEPIALYFPKHCLKALTNDTGFLASQLVSEKDSKFSTDVISTMSNLYFRGIKGWEEQFLKTGSKQASKDILVGLILETSKKIEGLSLMNSTISNGKKLVDGVQKFMAGQMIKDLLDSGAIKALNDKIYDSKSQSEFINLLLSGKAEKITNYLVQGTNLDVSQATTFVEKFYSSTEFFETASDILKGAGIGIKILQGGSNLITAITQFTALTQANDTYFELLDFVSENCNYSPMREAAIELKESLSSQQKYLLDTFALDVANFGFEQAFKKGVSLFPPAKLCYSALKLSQSISDGLFNISGKQEAYDKLRSIAYLNKTLSVYSANKQSAFLSAYYEGTSDQITSTAESYLLALNYLNEGRIKGEQLLQKYLSDSGLVGSIFNNSEALELSKKIEEYTKTNGEYFDLKGNGKKYISLCLACPVEISLVDKNGKAILTLKDGEEISGYENGIYYSVSKNPIDGDYIKVISVLENSDYSLKVIGTDDGAVDYSCLSIGDDGILQIHSVNNIPVDEGDVLTLASLTPTSSIILQSTSSSESKSYTPINQINNTQEVEKVSLSANSISIKVGEKQKIIPTVNPIDAAVSDVYWTSDDESIATVNNDGVITAISYGETVIRATTLNGVSATVKVNVKNSSVGNSGGGGSNGTTTSLTVQKNEMYRLYNPNSGEHFYTADKVEKDHLVSIGWDYEGLGWNAPKTSKTPVYRLYNENAGDHHYTTDSNEKDTLVRIGWKDEGTGWYSDDQKGVPLYRVYNPNAQAGSHHYTTDKTEQDYLVGIGWNNEGIAWYGMK